MLSTRNHTSDIEVNKTELEIIENKSWDAIDLTAFEITSTVKYRYDAKGYRVRRESSKTGVSYYAFNLLDGSTCAGCTDPGRGHDDQIAPGLLVEEKNIIQPEWGPVAGEQAVSVVNCFIYLNGKMIAKEIDKKQVDGNEGDDTYFYLTDHLGSTTLITDLNGEIVWQDDVTPFGETTGEAGLIDEELFYTGKQMDSETGLYYFNARWYDPALGKFITEDPIKDGLNWYLYVGNNPLVYVDPTGLAEKEVVAAAAEPQEQNQENKPVEIYNITVYDGVITYSGKKPEDDSLILSKWTLDKLNVFAEYTGVESYEINDPKLQKKHGKIIDKDSSQEIVSPIDISSDGRVTSEYGEVRSPTWTHKGIDIGAPRGTKIRSPGDGTIVKRDKLSAYGNNVQIKHFGSTSLSAHMAGLDYKSIKGRNKSQISMPQLPVGANVKAGAVIGLVGNTGNSTGPHLHFQMYTGGNRRNSIAPSVFNTGAGNDEEIKAFWGE